MYKVTGMGWFIVNTKTKRQAHSEGVEAWGRSGVTEVERATEEDIKYFLSIKGEDAVKPNNDTHERRV